MASILLPCYTSFIQGSSLKKHKLSHYCHANTSYDSRNFGCKNKLTSSFSSRNSVGVPLNEFPWASFDQYMEDKGRVIRAIFPEKTTTQQLNEEEWRVKMIPIQVLFLTCQPVIYIIAKCISEAEDYPKEIPGHITKFLEVKIVLRNYAEGIDNGLAARVLEDYNSFKRSKMQLL